MKEFIVGNVSESNWNEQNNLKIKKDVNDAVIINGILLHTCSVSIFGVDRTFCLVD